MAKDSIDLDGSPCDEDCAQLGEPGYAVRAMAECRQYIKAIVRKLGEPPEGCELRVRSNRHDFGTYHTVAVIFDDRNEKAMRYAFAVESDGPTEWTEEDRVALYEKLESVSP